MELRLTKPHISNTGTCRPGAFCFWSPKPGKQITGLPAIMHLKHRMEKGVQVAPFQSIANVWKETRHTRNGIRQRPSSTHTHGLHELTETTQHINQDLISCQVLILIVRSQGLTVRVIPVFSIGDGSPEGCKTK